jgi:hypothetical protein
MKIIIHTILTGCSFLLAGVAPAQGQSAPTNFQATVQGPTQVSLSWNAVAGTTGYHVFRATGSAAFSRLTTFKIAATRYTDASATPSTTFRYRVAAVDASGQTYSSLILTVTTPAAGSLISSARISSAAGTPPPQHIALAVPSRMERRLPTSGRYRISIAGFTVSHETYDDPLERDGKRDEVFVATEIQHFNRKTGALVGGSTVQSKVFGDANGFPDRVPQGRASGVGGLMTGDVVPYGWDLQSILPSPAPGWFPLVLWEGSLANDEDAVVLRPTIWEWDGDHEAFNYWLGIVTKAGTSTWSYGPLQQTVATPSISMVRGDWILCVANRLESIHGPYALPFGVIAGRDRPIGIDPYDPNGCGSDLFFDKLLLLTREKIEYELTRSGAIVATRLLPLRFLDVTTGNAAFSGDYTVYLRVERLP